MLKNVNRKRACCIWVIGQNSEGRCCVDALPRFLLCHSCLMLAADAQTLSFESWQDTMWNMVDAEGLASGWYFAALTIIGAFLLLNAFIAGIASVFMTLRRENQVHTLTHCCSNSCS